MNPSATPTHNAQTPAITYQVDFSRRNDHLADVTISFRADNDTPSLWLPTWIAGSYLIREFAKNITTVAYSTDANTAVHRAEKTSKNTWQLPHAKAGDTITVCYEVYCYDTSVRTAYVDHQRIFGNFTSLLLMVQNQENALCQITLDVPENPANAHAVLACGLMHTATRH
ncbi:M61 family metallopeptidase, partial [Moraxella caviae]